MTKIRGAKEPSVRAEPITGAISRTITDRLRWLTAMSSSMPSSFTLRSRPAKMPCVITTISREGTGSDDTTSRAARRLDRSAATKCTRGSGRSRKVRPTTHTSAPFDTASFTMARPTPLVPPITAMVRPRKSCAPSRPLDQSQSRRTVPNMLT